MPHDRAALSFSTLCALVVACSTGEKSGTPPVFGGQGAVVAAPGEQPLPAETKAVESGPCAGAKPPLEVGLVDDFEDGDNKIFKAFQREGWWWSADDKTAGATLAPTGDFKAERLADAESTVENRFAAHFTANGQKEWGAVWGAGLNWVEQGVRCPLNASTFTGIKFRARGQGSIRMVLGTPESLPPDGGGKCTQKCYDSYGKTIFLTSAWVEYTAPWDRLQQEGWGKDVRFDPSHLLQVAFKVDVKNLPADFWIDDIEFMKAEAPGAKSATK